MINYKGTGVTIKDGENINVALRRFKNKVEDGKRLEDIKLHTYYEKPTSERKRKAGVAKARHSKRLKNEQLPKKLY